MWRFAVDVSSALGVQRLHLQGATSDEAARLALSVAERRGWSGASVLDTIRLYRIDRR